MVINLFNNICWRIIADNAIVDADKDNWITKEEYRESIIKVIGQAVADCVTDKNEFANKKKEDVVTFAAEAKDYSPEHWNAVVLWNYMHILKWNYLNETHLSRDGLFQEVQNRICEKYPAEGVSDIGRKVEQAIDDIKEYDKELSLTDLMGNFYSCYKNTKEKTIDDLKKINSWCPLGRVKITDTNSALALQILMQVNSNNGYSYAPITIKEKDKLHFVCDYSFTFCGGRVACDIDDEIVEFLGKSKPPEYVSRDDKVIRSALEKLFSDFQFSYNYTMNLSKVIQRKSD